MVHAALGSRGVGNRFGTYFIELAKHDMQRLQRNLPDRDLAYFPKVPSTSTTTSTRSSGRSSSPSINRQLMMDAVIAARAPQAAGVRAGETAVNCHHNYVSREHHFGSDVW